MEHLSNEPDTNNRQLKSLKWIAERWGCSRQTCRRVLQRHGIWPFFLGGDARNATLRFDLQDILKVEAASQEKGCSFTSPSRERARGEGDLDGQVRISAPDIIAGSGNGAPGEGR